MTSVQRSDANPLVVTSTLTGDNINYPSAIKVPDWIDDPLGTYYMYFSHKRGSYIRLAYADDVEGPWTVHPPGTLHLEDTPFTGHIASPDVHVDHDKQVIRLYYHGETRARDLLRSPWINEQYRKDRYGFWKRDIPYRLLFNTGRTLYKMVSKQGSNGSSSGSVDGTTQEDNQSSPTTDTASETARIPAFEQRLWDWNLIPSPIQETRQAVSTDGLEFTSTSPILGPSWFAVFGYEETYYALARDGYVWASNSPDKSFSRVRKLFDDHRHFGVHVFGDQLHVYYSRPQDEPEGIVKTSIGLADSVEDWMELETKEVIVPEMEYEGADVDIDRSRRLGPADRRRELRDPQIFVDNSRKYLFYVIAGESGIGVVKLDEGQP